MVSNPGKLVNNIFFNQVAHKKQDWKISGYENRVYKKLLPFLWVWKELEKIL